MDTVPLFSGDLDTVKVLIAGTAGGGINDLSIPRNSRFLNVRQPHKYGSQNTKGNAQCYYVWCKKRSLIELGKISTCWGFIKHSWLEKGGVYSYRKIHQDLFEAGESCGKHRVARLMSKEGLRSHGLSPILWLLW